jgi:hypothetical protein
MLSSKRIETSHEAMPFERTLEITEPQRLQAAEESREHIAFWFEELANEEAENAVNVL